MDKAVIKSRLEELLSDVDVRIDQCDTVRIYWQRRIAFIRESEDGIKVSVMLLPEPGRPRLRDPYVVDLALDEQEAAEKAAKWLKRVIESGW